jgi:ABC-type amino acid transport substrate-binding protein
VGISADYFRLLEEKLGFKIEMVRYDSWSELLEDAKNKKVSGITAASKTEQRLEYFNFTVPYIFNPNVIITRKNFSEKLTFEKLNNSSMSIVAIEGFSVLDELKLNYPNLNYRTVSNAKEGLRKVSFGEADAMIVQLISASLSIDEDNITNLMVNSETTYDSNLSIATRNDWPILNDIFNKGLAQITDSEKNAIKSKWVPLYQDNFYDNPYFLPILIAIIGFFIFLFIIIFLWTITLKKKVREKTAELEKSKEELYFKSYHDDLTKLYNRAYYNEQIEYYALNPALPFTIIIADLNGLKIVNDTFGHEKGDLLIQKAADILKEQCREKDVLARIGGDEFVILMPQASC